MKKPIFIAEIKEKSPFGYKSYKSFHELMEIAITKGDWVSVHVNPLWGGSFEAIEYVRKFTDKPILAKHVRAEKDDIQKALDYGATYALVVDSCHIDLVDWYKNQILLEISSLEMLNRLSTSVLDKIKIVYNGRDLNTGIGKKYIGDYRDFRKKCNWLCGASLLKKPEDVQLYYPNCDAFIIGENLESL